jgi:hypothetical protein
MLTQIPRPTPSAHRSTGSFFWFSANFGETIFRITRLQASAMELHRLIRSWRLGTPTCCASLTPPSHDSLLQTFSNANIPLFDPGARDSECGPTMRAISVRLPQHVADYDARYSASTEAVDGSLQPVRQSKHKDAACVLASSSNTILNFALLGPWLTIRRCKSTYPGVLER